jgi:lysophospholipase L1-like esterase
MRRPRLALPLLLCVAIGVAGCTGGADPRAGRDVHWVTSWSAAQMALDPENVLPYEQLRDASLRQVVRVSFGGSRVRIRVSNVFGLSPLALEGASIARAVKPGLADIAPGSQRSLSFSGKMRVIIPAGASFHSDPVEFPHEAKTDIAISLHLKESPAGQTGHPVSRATTYVTRGNRIDEVAWPGAAKVTRWHQLSDVEVEAPANVGTVVAIGDSITDGVSSSLDGNDRWTDFLVSRLERERVPTTAVVNAGIGGNLLLGEGLGPNLLARFDRDALSLSGVTHAIVLIGVNDVGSQHLRHQDTPEARDRLVEHLQGGYRQLVERAHARGVCVIGGTILPFANSDYYRPSLANEADRQRLNQWIRTSGVFDAIADFDAATRDPAQPGRMRKEHDIGDGLHPSPAGFRAMAEAVPLAALRLTCNQAVRVSR